MGGYAAVAANSRLQEKNMGDIGDNPREIELVPVPETSPLPEPIKLPEPVKEPEPEPVAA
jgi:hypothetical protein